MANFEDVSSLLGPNGSRYRLHEEVLSYVYKMLRLGELRAELASSRVQTLNTE